MCLCISICCKPTFFTRKKYLQGLREPLTIVNNSRRESVFAVWMQWHFNCEWIRLDRKKYIRYLLNHVIKLSQIKVGIQYLRQWSIKDKYFFWHVRDLIRWSTCIILWNDWYMYAYTLYMYINFTCICKWWMYTYLCKWFVYLHVLTYFGHIY